MKSMIRMLVIVLVIATNIGISVAEAPNKTTHDMIEIARKIHEIDNFDEKKNNVDKIKKFLKDDNPLIRIIVLENLLSTPRGISPRELAEIEKNDPVWHAHIQ